MKQARIKKILLVFLFLAIFSLIVKDNQDRSPVKKADESINKESRFGPKETILFGVYSNGIKIGSGQLKYNGTKLVHARPLQQVQFKLKSFRIDDSETISGTEDFSSPVTVLREVNVFGKKETIVENYAEDTKSVVIEKKTASGTTITTTLSSDHAMDNVLLYIYKLRNDKELAIGKVYNVNLPTQKFELIVKDTRKIKVPLGVFDVFYVISSPSIYKFWISTLQSRLPLRIQGLASGGLVYLAASAVENPE